MNFNPAPAERVPLASWNGTNEHAPQAIDPSDLATILDAWQTATDRLQQTHESLRLQVQRLTDELEAKNRELARRDRLADLGQMASHIAHEVRNGILPLKLYLGLLSRQTQHEPNTAGLVDKIAAGFSSLESTVNDLLTFTNDRQPQRSEQEVAPLLSQVLEEISPHLRAHDIQVECHAPEGLRAAFDSTQIRRALVNLLLNAVDAMPAGGRLLVEVGTRADDEQGNESSNATDANQSQVENRTAAILFWRVIDSGAGIAEEVLDKLFDPFVTTKSSGTGLGLAIVERIAEAHGGVVLAKNMPAAGACFELAIPCKRLTQ